MEQLVDTLAAYPSSPNLSDSELDKQCRELLTNCLHKVTASNLASPVGGSDILTLLNPQLNSLSYLFVLCAKLDVGGRQALEAEWKNVVVFLSNYDPRQVKHGPKEFRRTVEAFVKFAEDADKPIVAVKALKKAILRSANPTTFSFMHHLFAQACLKARCFRDALPVLDIDIFDFPISKSANDIELLGRGFEVTYQDVLSYYLYGGMLYHGVKNWRRAQEYLQYAVAAPGNGCSKIQVEAFKKFILTGLLLDGRLHQIPRATPTNAFRIYKALCKPYEAFAAAFTSGDVDRFTKEVALTAEVFTKEGNSGLAQQCMEAFRRQQIIALKDTYVTLGVDEIAQKKFDVTGKGGDAGSKEETERVILAMIERGEIRATLSQSSSDPATSQTTVCFAGNPTADAASAHALEEQIKRIVALSSQVKHMDRKLGLTKEYLQFSSRNMKGGLSMPSLMGMDSEMMEDYGGGVWGEDDTDEVLMQDYDDDAGI